MNLPPEVIKLVVRTAIRRVRQEILWASAPGGEPAKEHAKSYIEETLTKFDALPSLSAALNVFGQTWPRL